MAPASASPPGRRAPPRPAPWRFAAILLDPPREELRAAIAARFEAMLAGGAIEEVRALLALGLDPTLPAMRAHGVPELAAHLRGELTRQEATDRVGLVTGQYTKRQATWFRHHELADPARIAYDPCAIGAIQSNYRKENTPQSSHLLKAGVDAPHHPAYRCAPAITPGARPCRQTPPSREQKFSSAP